jgi:hypothetical protein
MEIISLREYPFAFYRKYPNMVRDEKGRWVFEDRGPDLPLLLSVKATKKKED